MSEQNPEIKNYPISYNAVYQEKMSQADHVLQTADGNPAGIVLYFLMIAAGVVVFIAWWAILFTGKYPKGMYDFSVGIQRWSTRVSSYVYLLTDKYPPFSMDP